MILLRMPFYEILICHVLIIPPTLRKLIYHPKLIQGNDDMENKDAATSSVDHTITGIIASTTTDGGNKYAALSTVVDNISVVNASTVTATSTGVNASTTTDGENKDAAALLVVDYVSGADASTIAATSIPAPHATSNEVVS